MTKNEFLKSVPNTIDHLSWGYGELQAYDDVNVKTGQYKHKDGTTSGGHTAQSWEEVSLRMNAFYVKFNKK